MFWAQCLRTKESASHNVSWKLRGMVGSCLWGAILFGALGYLKAQDAIGPIIPKANAVNPEPTRWDLQKVQVSPGQPRSKDYIAGSQEYIICPDDDLDIYVLDVAELSRAYRVSPTGTIDVPLLAEPIMAVGQTLEQLSQIISEQLRSAGMVDHPHVTVRVKESRLHSVAIAGAVRKPQIYSIFGKTTVLDAISQAEGLATDAGNTAIITRGDRGLGQTVFEQSIVTKAGPAPNPHTVVVDLKRLLENGDNSQNFDLYPGDRLSVQRAGVVYVVGAVNKAGGFVLDNDREQMTVLKAVALANNITAAAAPKNAVIIRGGPKGGGGSQEIPVELDKILKHRISDRVLLANDILFVPESSGKKAMMRATEVAAQAAVVMIYRF